LNRIDALGFPASLIEAAGLAERGLYRGQVVRCGPTAAFRLLRRRDPPRFWLCTSRGEVAPPCVAWPMAAVGAYRAASPVPIRSGIRAAVRDTGGR